jgi:probable rRNA maturation factor
MTKTTDRIRFFTEELPFTLRRKKLKRVWIRGIITENLQSAGEINIIFCNDIYLQRLNWAYLKHKSLTDIITFPADEPSKNVSGDIFISVERVSENAKAFGVTSEQELNRVMIHGIFHLLGFGDKSETEAAGMRRMEDMALAKLEALAAGARIIPE